MVVVVVVAVVVEGVVTATTGSLTTDTTGAMGVPGPDTIIPVPGPDTTPVGPVTTVGTAMSASVSASETVLVISVVGMLVQLMSTAAGATVVNGLARPVATAEE